MISWVDIGCERNNAEWNCFGSKIVACGGENNITNVICRVLLNGYCWNSESASNPGRFKENIIDFLAF